MAQLERGWSWPGVAKLAKLEGKQLIKPLQLLLRPFAAELRAAVCDPRQYHQPSSHGR